MLFRRVAEHVRTQNWIAIAIDFVIVVTGVLLALWLSEWSQSRAQERSDQLAEQAVREEMLGNLAGLQLWRAMDTCHREQIEHIRDLLVESDGDWPGIQRRALFTDMDTTRTMPSFFILKVGAVSEDAWKAAVSSGAADRMPPEDRAMYAGMASQMVRYGQQMEFAREARGRIGGLVYPGKLSSGERVQALNELIVLEGSREYISRERDFSRIEITPEERLWMQGVFDREIETLKPFGTLRPCYRKPEFPPSVTLLD